MAPLAIELRLSDSRFPAVLKDLLGTRAPESLWALGNLDILRTKPLALFCSRKCPGKLILQTYDLAQKWRDAGTTVVGGFHSPMEQECLKILLRSPHPVVICPARSLPKRLPAEWKRPLTEGRLLLLSAFSESVRRATEESAHQRNLVVAALADRIFVAYAEPSGKTEFFCREIVAWGRPLITWGGNDNLVALGAQVVSRGTLTPVVAS
jgi:predicted Rossmann fold nucleotide-binding protein DprA/Smf involved in DNA uptake